MINAPIMTKLSSCLLSRRNPARAGKTRRALLALAGLALVPLPALAAGPVRVLMLGDSITAGLGLSARDALPTRLEAALKARGHDVSIINGGVSGDTVADGLARLDWALGDGVDAVIVALGANDALRGRSPANTRADLDQLLTRLTAKHLPVLVCGMLAPRNLGDAYAAAYDPIFADLAAKHGALLYPFLLDGVALDRGLNQADGMHPNPAGVAVIVERMAPRVEELLTRIGKT